MKATYKSDISCKKDAICEKTADYMVALSSAEYIARKSGRLLMEAHGTIARQKKQIRDLKHSYPINIEGIFKNVEAVVDSSFSRKIQELLEFKKHYEPILEIIEKEVALDSEIHSELKEMEKEGMAIKDVDSFIAEKFSFLNEKYDEIADW